MDKVKRHYFKVEHMQLLYERQILKTNRQLNKQKALSNDLRLLDKIIAVPLNLIKFLVCFIISVAIASQRSVAITSLLYFPVERPT